MIPFPFHKDRFVGWKEHEGAPAQCFHFADEEMGPERADGFPKVTELAS